jgi:hypothetical protein
VAAQDDTKLFFSEGSVAYKRKSLIFFDIFVGIMAYILLASKAKDISSLLLLEFNRIHTYGYWGVLGLIVLLVFPLLRFRFFITVGAVFALVMHMLLLSWMVSLFV